MPKQTNVEKMSALFAEHRAILVAEAEANAKRTAKASYKTLKDANWDLDKVAPDRSKLDFTVWRNLPREELIAMSDRRRHYKSLLQESDYKFKTKPTWRRTKAKEEKFIQAAMKSAEASFAAFLDKLDKKIGAEIKSASLEGRDPWISSILTVKTATGVQRWSTKVIDNRTSIEDDGKWFLQYPTRRLKD